MSDETGKYRPLSYFQLMEISLRELLVEKGIVTNEQVDAAVEDMRNRTPERATTLAPRSGVRLRMSSTVASTCSSVTMPFSTSSSRRLTSISWK